MDTPARLEDVEHLEAVMTTPSDALVEDLAKVDGDLMVLGVGGKMGPTLARLARRAAPGKRVIGVARFSEPGLRERLTAHGIECIAADLLDRDAIAGLPAAQNIVFMAGRKFGSIADQPLTWAMNALVPALVAERFADARIVAFSTACVYPYVPVGGPGAKEDVPPTPPPGEYANSCVARERLLEHFSQRHGTPGRLIRLSYAIDMRYGVLHDLARKILAGEPVDTGMGAVNVIWQGDANAQALRALAHCTRPTSALNVSGRARRVRDLAAGLARRLGKPVAFRGHEGTDAWLIDCSQAESLFGPPSVTTETLLDWTADWMVRVGESLDKPTHFETRDGAY